MKSHFIRLFGYDRFANRQISDLILASGQSGKPAELMAHVLAAQQIWLARCLSVPAAGVPLWPQWQADTFTNTIETNHQGWISFLENLQDAGLENIVAYKNSAGQYFKNTLTDVLIHVINHGTHHRAQIGQHLKLNGVESLPSSDYIFYIRDFNK